MDDSRWIKWFAIATAVLIAVLVALIIVLAINAQRLDVLTHSLVDLRRSNQSSSAKPEQSPTPTPTALLSLLARGESSDSAASPEMARLAKALAGDWNTVEIVQNGQPVPEGAGRRGTTHVVLTGGGTVLVSEGHSVGTVGGDLRWFITTWWDRDAKIYRFLTCFKTSTDAGCELRGTAHWDGDTFVNDYDEMIKGEPTKLQDIWTDITPNSHTLTEAHDTGNGVMKPYVVSRDTRQ